MFQQSLRALLTFECNDSPRCPRFIRESILQVLGESIRDAKVYEKLAPYFSQFCLGAKVGTILDLGSGTGEATAVFVDAVLKTKAKPPYIYISDLYPMVEAMAQTCKRYPDVMTALKERVDIGYLTQVPSHDMRMVLSAFHHFDEDVARHFLEDARQQGVSVFIAEPFTGRLKSFWPLFLHGFTGLARNGVRPSPRRPLKFFFTFLLPLIPICLLWDGLVSMIRMYDGRLLKMAQALPASEQNYVWQYKEIAVPLGGTASVFTGQPARAGALNTGG